MQDPATVKYQREHGEINNTVGASIKPTTYKYVGDQLEQYKRHLN